MTDTMDLPAPLPAPAVVAAAAVSYVVPPTGVASPAIYDARCRSMVSKSSYYFSAYWWSTKNGYPTSGVPTIALDEIHLREAASAAVVMAVTTNWWGYLSSAVTLDLAAIRLKAARLVVGVTSRHTVNAAAGAARWGHSWQSAYWAYLAGLAGWLLWDSQLTNTADRTALAAMVADEADYQLTVHYPEFWQHASDDSPYPVSGVYSNGPTSRVGDSAVEENLWNASVLSLAAAMMPGHPHAPAWRARGVEFVVTGMARKVDAQNTVAVVNGRTVNTWCANAGWDGLGYNLRPDYVVINHNKRNPDYMQSCAIPLACALHDGLASRPTPEAYRYNAKKVYGAMRTIPYPKPEGGTAAMYRNTATPDLFFPDGPDWGIARHAGYWGWDSLISTMVFSGTDLEVPVAAGTWDTLHGDAAKAMQDRTGVMPGGQIVLNNTEDSYGGREGWHALWASFVVLNKVLSNAGRLTWTSDAL